MHLVIVGASSRIAHQCARFWVINGVDKVTLIGRNKHRLESIYADLRVHGATLKSLLLEVDFDCTMSIEKAIAESAAFAPIDIALVAQGYLPKQSECQKDLRLIADAVLINGVSVIIFAEALVERMQLRGGQLGIISSVAGDLGRKSNYVYGSAKSLVSTYTQGLQHRLAGTELSVSLIKPGPVDTPMTQQLDPAPRHLADSKQVAEHIVSRMGKGKRQIYVPSVWLPIMLIMRAIPFKLLKRLNI